MATNITNAAVFTSASMKPVADEVITADWGQKMAENTGYLYHYLNKIIPIRDNAGVYYFWMTKPAIFDTLNILLRGAAAPSGSTTVTTTIFASGVSLAGTPTLTYADNFTATANTSQVRTVDISSLTDETLYIVAVDTGDADTSFVSLYF